MFSSLKKFRNAGWFRNHPYAYLTLWRRNRRLKQGKTVLFNAELFFDTRCNFRCSHCSIAIFQKQQGYPQAMDLAEITRAADELRRLDCFLCCLVGGETTLRKDLCEIVSVFHRRHILPTIITNGYLLDEPYILRLKKAGIFNIGVSLNGFTAEGHDGFVCKTGAFERALAVIDLIRKNGIATSIAAVPTHENLANGEYRRLIEFAVSRKIRVNVNYPALTGKYTDCYDELLTGEELAQAREYFKLPNVTSDFTVLADKYECPAGRKKIYILPDGSVCPCTFIHISFGNILKEPLEQIMQRLWSTKIFMSRPRLCLVGESLAFVKQYLEPVFDARRLPLYYLDHPLFAPPQPAVEACSL